MREVAVLTNVIMKRLFGYCWKIYCSPDNVYNPNVLDIGLQKLYNENPLIHPTIVAGKILYSFENNRWDMKLEEGEESKDFIPRRIESLEELHKELYHLCKSLNRNRHLYGLYSKTFYDLSQNLVLTLIIRSVLLSFFYDMENKYSKAEIAEYFLPITSEDITYQNLLDNPLKYIPFSIRYTLLVSAKEFWNNDRYFDPTISTPINDHEFNYELNHLPELEYHIKHWNFQKLVSQADNLYLYDKILLKKKRKKSKSTLSGDLLQFLHQCLMTVRESKLPLPKSDPRLLEELNAFNNPDNDDKERIFVTAPGRKISINGT